MTNRPKPFWGKVLYGAYYVINRSPLIPLKNDILEKVWTRKDVNYFHLKVFGCKDFVHIPKEQKQNFDDKATCIFLGYGDTEFGYKLWDPK